MMTTQPANLPLVPHYGAHNDQYYGNYALPQSWQQQQPTEQQSPTQQQGVYQENTCQASPPAPGAPATHGQGQPADLLDMNPGYDSSVQGYESSVQQRPQDQIESYDGIPAEVIASQERALAQIRQRQSTRQTETNNSHTALTVPLQVPPPQNPNLSDAVHPQKYAMKQQRKGIL